MLVIWLIIQGKFLYFIYIYHNYIYSIYCVLNCCISLNNNNHYSQLDNISLLIWNQTVVNPSTSGILQHGVRRFQIEGKLPTAAFEIIKLE